MNTIQQLIIDHIDIWTAAETEKKSGRGRSSGNSESVYGIKKLRELILELAVRGKLVPQDPNDEPASVLLKRIHSDKNKLIANGTIKKDKPKQPINKTELPFQLPTNWAWCRVGDIGHDWGQKIPDSDFTYIEVSAIDSRHGVISTPALVKPENAPSRARKLVKQGTILYSTVRPYLSNIAVIEKEFLPEPIASTAFAVIHPFCSMPSKYFLFFFRSPVFVRYVESVQMGIAYPAINDGQFFSGLIPLPPIEEQHRIVAKVDELMARCDQLETQHTNAAEAHEKLVSHLLGTLIQSQSAEDFSENWQRIAAHFDILFTTESSIDALKHTLLQLAVMGKLAPQDPNDEPACELLKRIQIEKAKLTANGTIKRSKPRQPVNEQSMPFELPLGWAWVRPEEFSLKITDGEHFRPPTEKNGIYFLSAKDVREDGVSLDDPLFISEQTARKALQRCNPEFGDLLIVSRGATVGRMCKVNIHERFCLLGSVILIKPTKLVLSDYLSIALKSPVASHSLINASGSTAQPAIYLKDLKEIYLPLPPREEQHRIVAKVNEIISLCDQLKNRITKSQQAQQVLADVMVKQYVS